MVRARSSVSGSGRSTSGYTDKSQNSSRWYYLSKPATNGYNGAYVDSDKPSTVPHDQREKVSLSQRECEGHMKHYEKLLLTYGRQSMASTTVRELLIDECGAYVDPDKPSSLPEGRRYRPTQFQCKLHLQKFEELVQRFGRDSLTATTNRELLNDKCGAYVDSDKPSTVPHNQSEEVSQRECEGHMKKYEELLLTYGRQSMASTTVRELLIDECGAYVDPDKPSSLPKGRRYRPNQFQCKLHLQKFEELVQKFGRDSLTATTNRELLIDKCGLVSDFDNPSGSAPKKPAYSDCKQAGRA